MGDLESHVTYRILVIYRVRRTKLSMWDVGWVNIRSTKRVTLIKVRKPTSLLIRIGNRMWAKHVDGRGGQKKVIRPRDLRRKIMSDTYLIFRTVSDRELGYLLLGRGPKVK